MDYDLFVIGAGSGGVRAARIAAGHGARVAVAEEYRVGGTCVIRGCVPKKLLTYAAHYADDFRDARGYGWTVGAPEFSWPALIAAKDKEIDRLNAAYLNTLSNAGCALFNGRAVLLDQHHLAIGDRTVSAAHILIATGGAPVMPEIPGIEHAISSNEAFHLPKLPRRVAVIGGGFIAVEFAGIFHGLGAETHLIYRGEKVLRGFDEDLRDGLMSEMAGQGMHLVMNAMPAAIEKTAAGLELLLANGDTLAVDCVMFATGRAPNTSGLGLEALGVALDAAGAVAVDALSRTSVPHIYAVGDVTNRVNLTPVAIQEGHAFADTVFGNKTRRVDHSLVPMAVFSHPNIATVGLTETQARAAYGQVDVYKAGFRPMRHTLSGRAERALMKLVVDARTDKILGAHMIGPDAPEILQGVAIAMTAGATKADFDHTFAIHPTAAEEFVLMRVKAG